MIGNGLPQQERRGRRERGRTPEQVRAEVARLSGGALPEAPEAEAGVLGALLMDHRVMGDVIGVLKGSEDFANLAHAEIYRTMAELYDRESSFDIIKLNQALVDRDVLDAVGGLEYLVSLARATPSATFALEYARIVREKSIVRAIIDTASEIVVAAHTSGMPARDLLASAEAQIFAIAQASDQAQLEDLKALLDEACDKILSSDGRYVTGVATGFYELDAITSGLQPGELIVLAARPSMGKTALALNVAENVAADQRAVAVFSLEMSRQQLVQRLICSRSGVDVGRFQRGVRSEADERRILSACGELAESRMYIDDTPGLTLLQLRAKARRLKERVGIDLVVIDYLQLMSVGGRVESRQIEVSEMSRGVKAMAREVGVPVVCLSQLNRAAESREGHRPRMSDLRESGSIEQDADVVMMLHREEYYHQGDENWQAANSDKVGVAELIIAKQRNGPTGTVRLAWNSSTTRFGNLAAGQRGGYGAGEEHGAARRGAASGVGGGFGAGSGYAPEGPRAAARVPEAGSATFSARPPTGPVRNHRDGGGPERGLDLDAGIDDLPV